MHVYLQTQWTTDDLLGLLSKGNAEAPIKEAGLVKCWYGCSCWEGDATVMTLALLLRLAVGWLHCAAESVRLPNTEQ